VSLRRRLLITLLLTAVPLIGGAVWLRLEVDRHAMEQALRDLASARVEAWGQEACEADPTDPPGARGPRPRPPEDTGPPPTRRDGRRRGRFSQGFPLRLFVYDREYRPADPEAPAFPAPLKEALEGGETSASTEEVTPEGRRLLVAVRTGWDDGPCAVALARTPAARRGPPVGGLLASAAALAGAFLIAVWIAVGPAVRRIRELTAAVRRSSATHYETPVGVAGQDEIAELARAFNEAATQVREHVARVEAREQTLRSFVANPTHDVMLPLTVLQGHLAALRQAAEAHGQPELVQGASEEAHYLASLVHNLGAAAKLEAGEPHVERHPVNLNELVERAAGRHRPIAAPRGIEVNTAVPEPPLWVVGDVTLIEQAVSNVIHNAVRYNHPGGHVAVVLEPGDDSRFRLRVFDDGPGVAEELLEHLAEPHYRSAEARTRSPGGQGLGLSIARQVAVRHGFELAIRRSEAGGLEVELQGPLT
jgi:signal transduction histidine kinase